MSKKNVPTNPSPEAKVPSALTSSPFGALASLRAALPTAPEQPEAEPREAAKPKTDPRFANKLVVARSKKGRGGKTVTVVRGVVGDRATLDALAKGLRHALGCGSSVEDGELVVQGEQLERVAAWLESQGAKRVVIGT